MKVRCALREVPYDLLKDKDYETYQDTETKYRILNEFKTFKYYPKEDFVEVKEEVMKIKEWNDINGKEINGNRIEVIGKSIYINFNSNPSVSMSISTNMKQSDIIAHLALLGIEVEFEKPMTITQIEWDMLNWYKHYSNAKIKRILSNSEVYIIKEDGWWSYIKNSDNLLTWLEIDKEYLVSDLLKCRIEG